MDKYYTALVIGGVTFGTAAIFIKFSNMTPGMIAFSRFLVAGIILSRGRVNFRNIVKNLKVGFLLAVHMILFILSVYNTTIIDSTVLVSTSPIFSLALSPLVGIPTTRKEIVTGLIAFLGVIIMNFPLNEGRLYGNLLAVLSALAISLYTIILSKNQEDDPLLLTSYVYLSSTIFSFPFLLIQGVGKIDLVSVLSLLGLIIFPTLIGHTSVIYASGHVKPSHIEVIGLLEPVVATVLSFFLFKQVPTSFELLGSGLVIISIALLVNR
ncbi:DMT family transporter [Metallosphaera tengchongensis]|uniref:DMT family transporter n=1 Tax=Metallosphaera tengchongensis TaxID=1532350 RepID=A0A6N0NTR0_9CREN|nr:DMT family transporter [Metallosphaera tengchongensis]QKQ99208.1 DMT family transporter [Metallosphaera tengchongensis]